MCARLLFQRSSSYFEIECLYFFRNEFAGILRAYGDVYAELFGRNSGELLFMKFSATTKSGFLAHTMNCALRSMETLSGVVNHYITQTQTRTVRSNNFHFVAYKSKHLAFNVNSPAFG